MIKKINQQGQTIILMVMVVTGIILVNSLVVVGGASIYYQNNTRSTLSAQALNLAEAGIDKALASLNTSGGNYTGEVETVFGSGSYSTSITTVNGQTRTLSATGYIPSKANPKIKKTITLNITNGVGASFQYGLQVGTGGVTIGSGSVLNGSIYSNGSIVGGNNNTITGDAWVAGGTQATADQSSDCSGSSCQDFIFGKNVNGNNQLDVAQSFQAGASGVMNKISLKLKKFGSPPNVTIRLLGNSNGKPNSNNVIASGTLSANLVTNQYSFVDVSFTSAPNIVSGTIYWVQIDTSADSNNYWAWSLDNLQGYTRGLAMWSPNWSTNNPTWNNIVGDLGFKTYLGGVTTAISLGSGSVVNGNVHANTISGIAIHGNAYYQSISGSTVSGTSFPNSADPSPIVMPISDANIATWKDEAASYGVNNGTQGWGNNDTGTMGPGKVYGNVSLGNGAVITIKTPIWVTGNVNFGNNAKFILDPSYKGASGNVIVDGTSSFGNGDDLAGSGTAGSYIVYISTYNSQTTGIHAIDTGNSSISGVLYVPYGQVNLSNGARFKEIDAWKLIIGNNSQLNYESGLASIYFSSGPTGSYTILPGTFQIK